MALKAYGVVGSLDTIHFNQIGEDSDRADGPEAVLNGLDVSLVTGLTLSVAPGRSYQANSNAILDLAQQVTLGARSTGNRIDRVVMQMDFTKGQDTAATLTVVPGRAVTTGAPVAPQLIRDVLTQRKWQTQLYRVLVPPTGALTLTDERIMPGRQNTRFAVRAARALTRQLIPASAWTTLLVDRIDHNLNDYGGTEVTLTGANQGQFIAPVDGTYGVSCQAHFVNQVGTPNTRRQIRILNKNASGATRWVKYGSMRSAGDNWDHVSVEATMDMLAGQTVEFQVWHDETHSVYLSDNATTPTPGSMAGGDMSYGMMTLIVPD